MATLNVAKIFDPAAREYRVRYVIRTILRDRIGNEAAFRNCLEMADADQVMQIILRRGLKNQKLRTALHRSHLINLDQWLRRRPAFSEAYYFPEEVGSGVPKSTGVNERRSKGKHD
jgi:hypothetical protein